MRIRQREERLKKEKENKKKKKRQNQKTSHKSKAHTHHHHHQQYHHPAASHSHHQGQSSQPPKVPPPQTEPGYHRKANPKSRFDGDVLSPVWCISLFIIWGNMLIRFQFAQYETGISYHIVGTAFLALVKHNRIWYQNVIRLMCGNVSLLVAVTSWKSQAIVLNIIPCKVTNWCFYTLFLCTLVSVLGAHWWILSH